MGQLGVRPIDGILLNFASCVTCRARVFYIASTYYDTTVLIRSMYFTLNFTSCMARCARALHALLSMAEPAAA